MYAQLDKADDRRVLFILSERSYVPRDNSGNRFEFRARKLYRGGGRAGEPRIRLE